MENFTENSTYAFAPMEASPDSGGYSEEDYLPRKSTLVAASEWADLIFYPIIVAIGLMGNVASFSVMMTKNLRNRSTTVYFSTLAVADTICLLDQFIGHLLRVHVKRSIHSASDVVCKLKSFIMFFTFPWAAWLVVCVTCERFVVTCFPFQAKFICTPRNARITVITITLMSAIYWIGNLFADGVGRGTCNLIPFYTRFAVWGIWVGTTLYTYIPTALLFLLNISISIILMKSSKLSDGQKDKSNRQVTITALTVSFTYLLLTIPSGSFITINFTGLVAMKPDVFVFVNMIMNLLICLNHAINFFIYVLTSRSFRETFLRLVKRTEVTGRGDGRKTTTRDTESTDQPTSSATNKV